MDDQVSADAELPTALQRYVLQPYRAARYHGAAGAERDLPQLLGAALLERLREYVERAVRCGTEEVGVVVGADGELVVLEDVGAGADAGGALDDRRVDAAMDDAPRGVVLVGEAYGSVHPGSGDLVKAQANGGEEHAARLEVGKKLLRHDQS